EPGQSRSHRHDRAGDARAGGRTEEAGGTRKGDAAEDGRAQERAVGRFVARMRAPPPIVALPRLLLASCHSPPPPTTHSVTPPGSFKLVAGSENTALEPIVREFCTEKRLDCSFTYEGSLDIGLALGSNEGVDADAVWPASSVWIDLFDTGRKVKNATSIAQMP